METGKIYFFTTFEGVEKREYSGSSLDNFNIVTKNVYNTEDEASQAFVDNLSRDLQEYESGSY